MAKYFTIREARLALMRMGLSSSVRRKVLTELRRKGGAAISPAELRNITRRMMWDTKDGISRQRAWRVRRRLKRKF